MYKFSQTVVSLCSWPSWFDSYNVFSGIVHITLWIVIVVTAPPPTAPTGGYCKDVKWKQFSGSCYYIRLGVSLILCWTLINSHSYCVWITHQLSPIGHRCLSLFLLIDIHVHILMNKTYTTRGRTIMQITDQHPCENRRDQNTLLRLNESNVFWWCH